MGRLRCTIGITTRILELSASTLIGRHWSCGVQLKHNAVPLYWLEIRWRDESWAWRVLSAEGRTRGTGRSCAQGDWRAWAKSRGHVRLDGADDDILIEMVDAAPPQPFVENLLADDESNHRLTLRHAEIWSDGQAWILGADPACDPPLRDGDVFAHDGGIYRIHTHTSPEATARDRISATSSDIHVDIDLPTLTATWSQGRREARIHGTCVRVLAVYAQARTGASARAGWLSNQAAHKSWLKLGGNVRSPAARMGWERGKLRSQLSADGVVDLEALFESRRRGKITELRLAIAAHQLKVHGVPDMHRGQLDAP